MYSTHDGLDVWIVRIAHSYVPGIYGINDGGVMADFVCDAINGRDIVLKSDGLALRAFCYITDCITALLTVMSKGTTCTVYNIANETEEYQIKDVAQIIAQCSPYPLKVVFNIPRKADAAYCNYKRVRLNTDKIFALGWRPLVNLRQGITKTLKSYEQI